MAEALRQQLASGCYAVNCRIGGWNPPRPPYHDLLLQDVVLAGFINQ